MLKEILSVKDLAVKVEAPLVRGDGKFILNGVNLRVGAGETHAVMGLNGSGKSTLAQVIAGNPGYQFDGGKIMFDGKNILDLLPHERAKLGIFLSFQYPLEILGVNVASFLRMIYNKRFGENISPIKFRTLLEEKMKIIDMKSEFSERYLNEGFSGGEKKRMEILQMLILEPKLVILDEVDSGLDVDALRSVANGVNWLRRKNPETAFIVITHYARILNYIKPDHVHIMHGGKIVKSGGFEIAEKLEESGYGEFGTEESGGGAVN
ncbi:MAG: Fe-S cluster assembly ATPase SufC [Patescibacteria group bacterium]